MSPVRLMPEQASTIAPRVDALYTFLIAVSAFFTIGIALSLLVFAVRYRRRVVGEEPEASPERAPARSPKVLALEIGWMVIPLALAMAMFFWGADIYATANRPPESALDIYVVGRQWMWKFQHPSGSREINELHVPLGRPIRLVMTSEDVIHSLFVPAFRVKYDVIPGRYTRVWFEPTRTGTYHLFCTEYCGAKHAQMGGSVYVMTPADYQAWLAGSSEGSLAEAGKKLFEQLGCVTCHHAASGARGPRLDGLFGAEIKLASGVRVKADEDYIRESLLDPRAKIVAGFQPIMPTYRGLVSEEGIVQLLGYLKTLSAPPDQQPPASGSAPSPGAPPARRPGARRR
jgi:cytochrome c oxidase subunit II